VDFALDNLRSPNYLTQRPFVITSLGLDSTYFGTIATLRSRSGPCVRKIVGWSLQINLKRSRGLTIRLIGCVPRTKYWANQNSHMFTLTWGRILKITWLNTNQMAPLSHTAWKFTFVRSHVDDPNASRRLSNFTKNLCTLSKSIEARQFTKKCSHLSKLIWILAHT
jgi:hypothetical protein